jgi:hypothetical protein
MSELRRQLASALQLRNASLPENDQDVTASRTKIEADMFEADFEYRQGTCEVERVDGRTLVTALADAYG